MKSSYKRRKKTKAKYQRQPLLALLQAEDKIIYFNFCITITGLWNRKPETKHAVRPETNSLVQGFKVKLWFRKKDKPERKQQSAKMVCT